MRTRAYIDGEYRWIDHGEGFGGSIRFGGHLVVGASGPGEIARAARERKNEVARVRRAAQKADAA